jgi:hypothetical protein
MHDRLEQYGAKLGVSGGVPVPSEWWMSRLSVMDYA